MIEIERALRFIAHDVPSVARIADRVLVGPDGRVAGEGEASVVLGSPSSTAARRLLAAVPGGWSRAE